MSEGWGLEEVANPLLYRGRYPREYRGEIGIRLGGTYVIVTTPDIRAR